MRKKLLAISGLLGLALTCTNAFALRCGHLLVEIGDHKSDVVQKCGPPDFADQRLAATGLTLRHPGGALQLNQAEQIVIDEWTYNFGPRRFKQFLIFENGILVGIENLGRGN